MNQLLHIALVIVWLQTSGRYVSAASSSPCKGKSKWKTYNKDKCYALYLAPVNFQDAKGVCRSQNAYLATVQTKQTSNWISENFPDISYRYPAWMGLTKDAEGEFLWDDGVNLRETVFNSWDDESRNLLKQKSRKGCVAFGREKWIYKASCTERLFIFCELRHDPPPTACDTNNGGCEDLCTISLGKKRCGCTAPARLVDETKCKASPSPCKGKSMWKTYNEEKCYAVFLALVNFQEAKGVCRSKNAYLATVQTKQTSNWISKNFPDISYRYPAWMGLIQDAEGEFLWDDGVNLRETVFNSWDNESRNLLKKKPRKGCVALGRENWIYKTSCTENLYIFCELRHNPPPTACETNNEGCEDLCTIGLGKKTRCKKAGSDFVGQTVFLKYAGILFATAAVAISLRFV